MMTSSNHPRALEKGFRDFEVGEPVHEHSPLECHVTKLLRIDSQPEALLSDFDIEHVQIHAASRVMMGEGQPMLFYCDDRECSRLTEEDVNEHVSREQV